jgi:O-antigen/teichoic acid export membrane protein
VVVAVLVLDGGPIALATGYVAASLLGLLFYVSWFRRVLRERGSSVALRQVILPWRTVLAFSFPMLSAELVYLSMSTGSVLLLAAHWGAQQVAEYRAVFPAARLNQFVYASFATLYVPMAARLFARGDRAGTRDTYWHTAVILAVLSFPVFALTGPFADATTVLLFGERYQGSGLVLLLLSAGFYLNVCLGMNMHTLQVYGRVRFLLQVNIAIAVLNLVLSALLVPEYGPRGVAVANTASLVIQNVVNQLAMRQVAGVLPDRAHARPYVLIVLLVGLLGAVQLLLAPPFVVAFLLSAAASLLLLVACRDVLRLEDTFPELGKVPGLRRLVRS